MEDHTIAERSSAYRRKAWKEYLKGLSPCARAGLERLQASRDAVNAETAEALLNALPQDQRAKVVAEASQAGREARDRVLMSAGYDPALVTNGDTANAISPFVPAPIRTRAQSASTRARTTAILRHPALGDPTASPLATGTPSSCRDFVQATCGVSDERHFSPNSVCMDCPANCGNGACSCRSFYYVIYIKFNRLQWGSMECACQDNPVPTGCECRVPKWRQVAVPTQREVKMCASILNTTSSLFPIVEAWCSDCADLSRVPSEGDGKCKVDCQNNPRVPCCAGRSSSCRPYCDSVTPPLHHCDRIRYRSLEVSKGTLCAVLCN
ncbi:MAG: hypothetical protein V2G42_08660 [bacterium JZ-2024 1]